MTEVVPEVAATIENDFPFYNGVPVALSRSDWAKVLGSLALGFVGLTFAGTFGLAWPDLAMPAHVLSAILFTALPLFTLSQVAPGHWRVLYRTPHLRDIGWVLLFLVLALVAVSGLAALVAQFFDIVPNRVEEIDFTAPNAPVWLAIWITIQLMGEELFTLLPFLALMQASYRGHRSRKRAMMIAWLGSSLIFALVHLPAYHWNLAQCLTVILTLRLVLTVPYLITRNIWVTYALHLVYDGLLLTVAVLVKLAG